MSDDQQLELLDEDAHEREMIESERARGIFSGERLQAHDPERYALIRELVLDGAMSHAQIARAARCSRNTVRAVARREVGGRAIDHLKSRLAGVNLLVAGMTADALVERLSDPAERRKIPFQQLAVAHGISVDKLQVLTGGPTSIVGQSDAQPGADPEEFVRGMREMHLGEGEGAPKGVLGVGGGAEEGGAPAPAGPDGPGRSGDGGGDGDGPAGGAA